VNTIYFDGSYIWKCYRCEHRRHIFGNAHIRCANPDPNMTGFGQGVDGGWFNYPENFDPTWMSTECANFSLEDDPRKE